MLLICQTCPRYDARASGDFGRDLNRAIDEIRDSDPAATVNVRKVQCLGGCPADGVVALDSPGKARVRFTDLDPSYAKPVVEAARAYDASASGVPDDWPIPDGLAGHLSSVTIKRLPLWGN